MMPHYQLDDVQMGYLDAYLKTLSAVSAPGIDESRIHFASVITEDTDLRQRKAMTDVFDTFLRDKNFGPRYEHAWAKNPLFYQERKQRSFREWEVHLWYLQGPPQTWGEQLQDYYRRQPVFALLGGLAQGEWQPIHAFCEQQQIPCLLPSTDLPMLEGEDIYTIYFSRGMTLEGEILADYWVDSATVADCKMQIYRNDAAGRTAAAALRKRFPGVLIDRPLAADFVFDEAGWRRLLADIGDNTSLVLWLTAQELNSLPDLPEVFANIDKVYLSSSLSDAGDQSLPPSLRDKAYFIHPFALPQPPAQGIVRTTGWLHSKGVEVSDVRIQANTLTALTLANVALMHMLDFFSREYFLERIEHAADNFLTTSVYRHLSLGPGQRFMSKGGYIARLSTQPKKKLEALTSWIVPEQMP
jgi:hypothetical protein